MDADTENFKKIILQTFKISGFAIRSDSAIYLAHILSPLESVQRKKCLVNITRNIQNQGLENPHVEKKHIELAIKECNFGTLNESETTFNVINAFDVPKFIYNNERKKFILDEKPNSFLPKASAKADYILDRYTLLWQRTARNRLFSNSSAPLGVKETSNEEHFKLTKVEVLLSTSRSVNAVVLGYLTQLKEGKFHVEDPTGIVELNLSKAKFQIGLFCEGCFVLANGRYVDGVLKVTELGFPPPEEPANSRAFFGTVNTWGGPSKTLLKYSVKLAELEKTNASDTIVFVSDCWLDNPLVMDKLKLLFLGYNAFPPIAIVLMGPFVKHNENPFDLKAKLTALGNLVGSCERLKRETDLVLVPAVEDPSSANILPRPPIPEFLAAELKKLTPRLILATNPCRLQYCTQQIVVCRSDLVTKLCRNTIKFPTDGDLAEHFARTLLSQATLVPLHPIAQPVFWQYNAALSLYPLPDLIVVGDPSTSFQSSFRECTVLNTGSFPKSKFGFKVYLPSSRTVEDSQVPDEE